MLFGDLGTADTVPRKSGIHNELPGKKALRSLECAAGAGIFQRLFGAALLGQVRDPCADLFRISGGQIEPGAQSRRIDPSQDTGPVPEFHLLRAVFPHTAVRHQKAHCPGNKSDLAAVGACIHHQSTSHCPGDPCSKFQAGQSMFQSSEGSSLERGPRARCDTASVHADPVQRKIIHAFRTIFFLPLRQVFGGLSRGGDDHSAVSAVSDQEICSLSQQKAGFSAIPQELQKSRHLFFCFDFYQRIRRTAGTERTVSVHGFII